MAGNAYAAEEFNVEQYVAQRYFEGNAENHAKAKRAGLVKYCNKYVYLKSERLSLITGRLVTDAASFYLNKDDGSVFSACAGACFMPRSDEQKDVCKNKCPPKDLDCSNTCQTWNCSILDGDIAAAKRLLGDGQDVNQPIWKNGPTALQHTAQTSNFELIKVLLDAKANVNSTTEHTHLTPLCLAINYNLSVEIIKSLVDAGADITVKCGQSTALEYARNTPHKNRADTQEVISFLQQHSSE